MFYQFALAGTVLLALSLSPVNAQKSDLAEPWLMTASQTRHDILAELAPKAAQPPYDKVFPLLQKAQAELAPSAAITHSAAVDDAYDATLLVMTQTQDHVLAARLFDSFLLAALRFASPDSARYDGRLHLLKIAVSVYGQVNLPDRQLAALRLLQQEAGDNQNLQDWANLQLASIYAQRKQYAPAMDALGAVRSPVMMGPVSAIPDLQQKLSDQEQAAAATPVHSVRAHKKSLHKKQSTQH